MDNNFNNNQFEPEKPFTEKPNEPQPAPVFENEKFLTESVLFLESIF